MMRRVDFKREIFLNWTVYATFACFSASSMRLRVQSVTMIDAILPRMLGSLGKYLINSILLL